MDFFGGDGSDGGGMPITIVRLNKRKFQKHYLRGINGPRTDYSIVNKCLNISHV